jgi:hypothetical protein
LRRIPKPPAGLAEKAEFPLPLDLLEIRRQLIALRSLHSHETRATTLINRVLAKISHLHEPENEAHERRLRNLVAKVIQTIEGTASQGS